MIVFAPEYSKKEKIIHFAMHMAWFIPLYTATKYIFLPWFRNYAEYAHCYKYGSITGTEIVFYGILTGIPLISAFVWLLIDGMRCFKTIRIGQSPLPGEKVFNRTRYTYGFRAKLRPYVFLALLSFLIGLSIKGFFDTQRFISKAVDSADLPSCTEITQPKSQSNNYVPNFMEA